MVRTRRVEVALLPPPGHWLASALTEGPDGGTAAGHALHRRTRMNTPPALSLAAGLRRSLDRRGRAAVVVTQCCCCCCCKSRPAAAGSRSSPFRPPTNGRTDGLWSCRGKWGRGGYAAFSGLAAGAHSSFQPSFTRGGGGGAPSPLGSAARGRRGRGRRWPGERRPASSSSSIRVAKGLPGGAPAKSASEGPPRERGRQRVVVVGRAGGRAAGLCDSERHPPRLLAGPRVGSWA